MDLPTAPNHTRRTARVLGWASVVLATAAVTLTTASDHPAAAHPTSTTIVHTVPGATSIGIIGDSTLAGVRWYQELEPLNDYSFVLDAESCRRTVETVLLEPRGVST